MTKEQIATMMELKGYEDTNKKLIHTSPGTYTVVSKTSFKTPTGSTDNRHNRPQSLWKMSLHVIVQETLNNSSPFSDSDNMGEIDRVLDTWKCVTSKDPDSPNKIQSIYITTDGQNYQRYDANANPCEIGVLDHLIKDHCTIAPSSLEVKFKMWLPLNGVTGSKVLDYVSHLKAVSESPVPHTQTGAWNGFYYDLTGRYPTRKVFEIDSLEKFDVVYAELKRFLEQTVPNPTGYNAVNYQNCYDYSHNSNSGDQLALLNAFKKYRDFLSTLVRCDILAAVRTKPFLLLAGISGTGKSRLVRQLARGCCPADSRLAFDDDAKTRQAQKPGNFEMIPVRPNWHDSSELMGYVTRITDDNKPKYVIKPFVKFLVKAMIYSDVPFFLCLDEMNLAPVEQYFAEYLSVVETRKVVKNEAGDVTDIVSDVLVDFDQPEIDPAKTVQELMQDWIDVAENGTVSAKPAFPTAKAVYEQIIADKGVRIPRNFIVMGTVNMDETTCSFSRKVLDRAMTFELNEVDMDAGLATDNKIAYGEFTRDAATATAVEGFDFYGNHTALCDTVKTYLQTINNVLEGTPFKFAYRSRNEIMLYCIERTKGDLVGLPQALDEATSMKVLSRIEGDDQKLVYAGDDPTYKEKNLLQVLEAVIPAALKAAGEEAVDCDLCVKKLKFMERRLNSGFTNFFV